jgi:hypothetical protein
MAEDGSSRARTAPGRYKRSRWVALLLGPTLLATTTPARAASVTVAMRTASVHGAIPARIPGAPTRAESALVPVVAAYGINSVSSGVLVTGAGPLAAIEYGMDDYNASFDILAFDGAAWHKRQTLTTGGITPRGQPLTIGMLGPDTCAGLSLCIQLAHLTGWDATNLVFTVPLGVNIWYFVVDVSATAARLVPFNAPGQPTQMSAIGSIGEHIQGGRIVTTASNCVPNCATGSHVSTVWQYNGPSQAFVPVGAPAVSPPAREDAAMAYDPATSQVVMYGGRGNLTNPFLADTWVWDGSVWHQTNTDNGGGHGLDLPAMAYDQATSQLVLVTNYAEGNNAVGRIATHLWNGTGWDLVHPTSDLPLGGTIAGMVYQPSTSEMILVVEQFDLQTTSHTTQTWSWDGHNWTQLHPATDLPAAATPMAYDATTGLVIREGLGGETASDAPAPATWVWDGSNWTELKPAHHPSPTLGAAMAYDNVGQQLVYFGGGFVGGGGGCGTDTDRWVWDGQDWSKADPPPDIVGRSQAAMAYDDATGQLLAFGGCTELAGQTPQLLQDTVVVRSGQPAPSGASPTGSKTEPKGCGTGISASATPKWIDDANKALAKKARNVISIAAGTITLTKGLYLNWEPGLEPGQVMLCAVNLGGQLLNLADPWKNGQMSVEATSSGTSATGTGSSTFGPFTYSANDTGWVSTPGAPRDQPFVTNFQPQADLLPGADLQLGTKGPKANLTLFEVKLASVAVKVKLVVNAQQALTAELGPTLDFKAEISKQNLLKELADDLETTGSESQAIDEVSTKIADDEAAAAASDGEGFFGLTPTEIEQRIESTMRPQMRQALADFLNTLEPGPDADFLKSEGVTANEVSGDAAAALGAEDAAGADFVAKLGCDVLFGGPEDVVGDAICIL